LRSLYQFYDGFLVDGLRRLEKQGDVPMDSRGRRVSECAFALFPVDKAPVYQIAQSVPNRYTTDSEAVAKLILTFNGEGLCFPAIQDFLGQSSHDATACRQVRRKF
jgi:hypothetical protein